jgi:hypothetical protein
LIANVFRTVAGPVDPIFSPCGPGGGPGKREFQPRTRPPGFGNVGIAAAARTGHNAAWHDIASGLSDRPCFRARREVADPVMNEPAKNEPAYNEPA